MTNQSAADTLKTMLQYAMNNQLGDGAFVSGTRPQEAVDQALKALYDLAVAALPEKTPNATFEGTLPAITDARNKTIDQSIEALAKVFNQEEDI